MPSKRPKRTPGSRFVTVYITKASTSSLLSSGLGEVKVWFRRPVFWPGVKCPFTGLTQHDCWGTNGPGPQYISGYHLRDTKLGLAIWALVEASQKDCGTWPEWKELPNGHRCHWRKWRAKLKFTPVI